MAGRFPGARNVEAFWGNLRSGVESIEQITDEALRLDGVPEALLANPDYVKVAAPLAGMENFDAPFFGLSPREAAIMDPQHRQFLEVAWEALEHGGCDPKRHEGLIGVFAGSGHNAYMPYNLLSNPSIMDSSGLFLVRHTGNDKDFLTTRVSYLFDLRGPSLNIQTACSTSLVAIHVAAQSLLVNECDMALAGGVTIELPHRHGYHYEEGEILSPDGHCRAFDASSKGTVFGSAVGAVLLKRAIDAVRDGDTIHALIRGSAVNNDGGLKAGYLAPSVDGQAQAIAGALAIANVSPDTISYVETHGTGTPVGDPIEIAALAQAFRTGTKRSGYCRVGSVKTNIGHTDTAAGVASFIKVVEALRHRELPPSLHFSVPNPACSFDQTPFVVNASLAPWGGPEPRRAGVNSLGVGGTNAHVILEEAPLAPVSTRVTGPQVLTVSARSVTALAGNCARLADHLVKHPDVNLADVAWTLQMGRQPMPYRRAVVAETATEAAALLSAPPREAAAPAVSPRPVCFMFAGGGAQYAGMGRELYESEPVYRDAVDECLSLLAPILDYDLRSLLLPKETDRTAAASELERPSRTLPALFVTQHAQARLWRSWGIEPAALLGHSMGEYTAAHLAGVFSLENALRLVHLRGQLFEAVPSGGMLSVALAADELASRLPAELSIAAINAPNLSVASGPGAAIESLQRGLEASDIDCVRVRIRIAAHSSMLDPILDRFRAFFSGVVLSAPQMPVLSNLTGTWLSAEQATSADYWVRQLRETVRFAEGIATVAADASIALLEVGPGRTLATLARQHTGATRGHPIASSLRHPDEAVDDRQFMLDALGQLWTAGVQADWSRLHRGARRRKIPLPTYAFDATRHWIDAGKPAPAAAPVPPEHALRRRELDDWFLQPSWKRSLASPTSPPVAPVLVLTDELGVSQALTGALEARSIEVLRVARGSGFTSSKPGHYTVRPEVVDDWRALLRDLGSQPAFPTHIVHAFSLDGWRDPGQAPMQDGYFSLLALSQALGAEDITSPLRLVAVTSGAQMVSGETRLEPGVATINGMLKVLPREFPNIEARAVDVLVPLPDSWQSRQLAAQLADELSCSADADTIALRGDDRWLRTWEPIALPSRDDSQLIRRGGTYLITGGLGGIGLALAQHLAERFAPKLILLSRTPASSAHRRLAIEALEQAGATVMVAVADVTEEAALSVALATARQRFGPIQGVFHTAGVLSDGVIQLKDPATSASVFAPKVAGTLALEAATAGDPLDFLMLFSSVSAIAGPAGQVDYAAANAFLDAYAPARRARDGVRAISVNWAAWRDVGMAATMARDLGMLGVSAAPYPVLARAASADGIEQLFTGRMSAAETWMLREHRVRGGDTLIPGTGHLELARAAFQHGKPGGRLELADVAFRTPLSVGDEVEVGVRLVPSARGMRFSVLSRVPGTSTDWTEHSSGHVGALTDEPREPLDIASIAARCHPLAGSGAGDVVQHAHLEFGPRWHNVSAISFAPGEALLQLQLDASFADDLARAHLHPALLDMATAGAQALIPGFDATRDFFVPAAYERLRMHAPLPASCVSHVTLRTETETGADIAMFDVVIAAPSGDCIVEVEGFTMARVRDRHLLKGRPGGASGTPYREPDTHRHPALANRILELGLRDGIRTAEGMLIIERLLAGRVPAQVVVSPHDLDRWIAELSAPASAWAPAAVAPAAARRDFSAVAAVLASLRAVREAAVVEHIDQAGEQRVVAYVAFVPGEHATNSELRRACRQTLSVDLIPQTFMELDDLPHDASGTVALDQLSNPFGVVVAAAGPDTEMERIIAALWVDLLGTTTVRRHDNFFDVGGHSLLSMRLISRVAKKTGVRLLHEHIVASTLQQLAARVEQSSGMGAA